MRLLFLRHGESEYNLSGLCNADPDVRVGLTLKGRAQAEAAAERIRDARIDKIYVSRLLRAQETASIINKFHDAEISMDARLDDRLTGFEGLPVAEYLRVMNETSDPFSWKVENGESYIDMVARVNSFLTDLISSDDEKMKTILIVTHHEVLQAVEGYFNNLELHEMWKIWMGNCHELEFDC